MKAPLVRVVRGDAHDTQRWWTLTLACGHKEQRPMKSRLDRVRMVSVPDPVPRAARCHQCVVREELERELEIEKP